MVLTTRDENLAPSLAAVDPNTGEVADIGMDADSKTVNVNTRVWDTDNLEYIRMQQPLTSMDSLESIASQIYWNDKRYDYDANGSIIYTGMNTAMNATTSGTDWYVVKIDYTDGNVVQERMQITSWDARTQGWS